MTPDDSILAAELVLGLVDDADRGAALERVLADPDFADEVAWWREKLSPMLAHYDDAVPSEALAGRIDAMLDGRSRGGAAPSRPRRWPWVTGGALSGALAASLATFLLVSPATVPTAPVPAPRSVEPHLLAAALAPSAGEDRAPVAVVINVDAKALRLAGSFDVPRNRSAELWRIGANKVPVALGVLQADGSGGLTLTAGGLPQVTDTIAVSIEPKGGAPGPAPSGPVVATGVLDRI